MKPLSLLPVRHRYFTLNTKNPGRFGPIPVRSGSFGPISVASRFGPAVAGHFGPVSKMGRFGLI